MINNWSEKECDESNSIAKCYLILNIRMYWFLRVKDEVGPYSIISLIAKITKNNHIQLKKNQINRCVLLSGISLDIHLFSEELEKIFGNYAFVNISMSKLLNWIVQCHPQTNVTVIGKGSVNVETCKRSGCKGEILAESFEGIIIN